MITDPSKITVTHEHGRSVGVGVGSVEILRYVYGEDIAAFEAPKPYAHPIRTLSGAVVSAYRPSDHRWHKGLQMTWSHVSGQNFWGGNTYVRGTGYVPLDNVGAMRHDSFDVIEVADGELSLVEHLTWTTAAGGEWVSERRTLRVRDVDPAVGAWTLEVSSTLRNVRGEPLELGSPTTQGRHNAGYTGWFWRGPRGLTGGEILTPDGGGPEVMGTRAEWLAYTGPNDDVDGSVTVIVTAGETSHGTVTWFVRNDPFPAVNPSPAFHDPIVLAPREELTVAHRFVVADGAWSREQVAAHLAGVGS